MGLPVTASTAHFVTLAEVKAHLDKSSSADDAEVYRIRNVAEEQVERIIGPVLHRTVTEVHRPRGRAVVLNEQRVLSITSVADQNTAVLTYTSAHAGVLYGLPHREQVTVVYVAGRDYVDDSTILATCIIAAHLWKTQRGGAPAPGAFDEELVDTPHGFAIPRRASDLLDGRGPVIA